MLPLKRNLEMLYDEFLYNTSSGLYYLHPIKLIQDIDSITSTVSYSKIGHCSELLFNSSRNILKFVNESIKQYRNDEDHKNARKAVFVLLRNYINKIRGGGIREHALMIIEFCIGVFRKSNYNGVRMESFGPLFMLFSDEFMNAQPLDKIINEENLDVNDIFNKYFRERNDKQLKKSPSLRGKLIEFLCLLLHKFPHLFTDEDDRVKKVRNMLFNELNSQKTKKTFEASKISFLFSGLRYYLTKFSVSVKKEQLNDVYVMVRSVLQQEFKTFSVLKSVLDLLKDHSGILKENLVQECPKLFHLLVDKCSQVNKEVRRKAFGAFTKFLSIVVKELHKNIEDKDKYDQMIIEFHELFAEHSEKDDKISRFKFSLGIQSFGNFSTLIAKYDGEMEVKKYLLKMFKMAERVLKSEDVINTDSRLDAVNNSYYQIPYFIESFSNFFLVLGKDNVEKWMVDKVFEVVHIQLEIWPQFFGSNKIFVYRALAKLIISLKKCSNLLKYLLEKIVMCSLSYAMSTLKTDDENMKDSVQRVHYSLWINLMDFKLFEFRGRKSYYPWNEEQLNEETKKEIFEVIYDSIMKSILYDTVDKFDLAVKKVEISTITNDKGEISQELIDEGNRTDKKNEVIDYAYISMNASDTSMFKNLVKFLHKFLHRSSNNYFMKWVYPYINVLLRMWEKYQENEHIYKLLTNAMDICERSKYFENLEEEMIDEKKVCFLNLKKMVKEVITLVKDYKGDLLFHSLVFLLSMPIPFIDLTIYQEPLKLALKTGLSYLPLSKVALQKMEHWDLRHPDKNGMGKCLSQVLPVLEEYLIVESSKEEEEDITTKLDSRKTTIKKKDENKEYVKERIFKKRTFSELELTKLSHIQLRIVKLLGRLGGENVKILNKKLKGVNEVNSHLAWDRKERLFLKIVLGNGNYVLFFDKLLPRICNLAEKSGESQIKISACEFLYSMVLLMIGYNSTNPNRGNKDATDLHKIFKKIFPVLLRLSVDNEVITKQLFSPLVFQITHWLTQNSQYENRETMALLDAIINGLCSPDHGSLRNLCASLFKEFFIWSIKHDNENNQKNLRSVFKRLFGNSQNPNRYKRLGSMLAFNKIYRYYRENKKIVGQFTNEWLHHVIMSLKFVENASIIQIVDENTKDNVVKATIEVIDHLIKIIKSEMGMKVLNLNKYKKGFHKTFEGLIIWIFEQTGNISYHCRKQSQRVFYEICECLDGFQYAGGRRSWINTKREKGIAMIIRIAESFESTINNNELTDSKVLKLSSSIDCYTWFFKNKIVFPAEIYSKSDSVLLSKIQSFFKDIKDLKNDIKESDEKEINFKVKKLALYCNMLFVIFDFISFNLEYHSQMFLKYDNGKIVNGELFKFLLNTLLFPYKTGFDTNDLFVQKNLMKHGRKLLNALLKVNNEKITRDIKIGANFIVKSIDFFSDENDVNTSTFLFRGFRLLVRNGLIDNQIDPHVIGEKLFDSDDPLNPTKLKIQTELWDVIFDIGFNPMTLIEYLRDRTLMKDRNKMDVDSEDYSEIDLMDTTNDDEVNVVKTKEEEVKLIYKGEYFYDNFQIEIDKFIAKNFKHFSQVLFKESNDRPLFLRILNDICFYTPKYLTDEFTLELIKYSGKLLQYFKDSNSSFDFKLEMLRFIKILFHNQPESFNSLKKSDDDDRMDIDDDNNSIIEIIEEGINFKTDQFEISLYGPSFEINIESIKLIPLVYKIDRKKSYELLNNIAITKLPLSYKEFDPGTEKYENHILLVRELLKLIAYFKDVKVFENLVFLFRWTEHPLKNEMDNCINGFFQNLSAQNKENILMFCVDYLFDDNNADDVRKALIQYFVFMCLPLIDLKDRVSFFKKNLKRVLSFIIQKNVYLNRINISTHICCFELIAAMARLCPSEIKHKLNKFYVVDIMKKELSEGKKGNELLQIISKTISKIMEKDFTEETKRSVGNESLFEYRYASFNALSDLLISTQRREKIFKKYIFKKNCWDKFVDHEKEFIFPVITCYKFSESILSKLVQVGKTVKNKKSSRVTYERNTNSSLSQDESNPYSTFNLFSTSDKLYFGVDTASEEVDNNNEVEVEDKMDVDEEIENNLKKQEEKQHDTLELDELNSNPFMVTLIRVIDHIIGKLNNFNVTSTHLSDWMGEVLSLLKNPGIHKNLRFFVMKLILNRKNVFKFHVVKDKYVLDSFIEIGENTFGSENGINYFVRDICAIILAWKLVPADDHGDAANKFLGKLIERCYNTRNNILKSNLKIIDGLIKLWGDIVTVPTFELVNFMKFKGEKFDKLGNKIGGRNDPRIAGYQLCGIFLKNEMNLYYEYDPLIKDKDLSEKFIYNYIFRALNLKTNDKKMIYSSVSEIAGLTLKYFESKREEEKVFVFSNCIKNYLDKIEDKSKLVTCLEYIGTHYQKFLDQYIDKMFELTHDIFGPTKISLFKIIYWRVGFIKNIYYYMKRIIEEILKVRNSACQMLILKIFKKALPELTNENIFHFLNVINKEKILESKLFERHCRKVYYDILIMIYDRAELKNESIVRFSLLRGMSDECQDIRTKLLDFWDNETRLSKTPRERLEEVFRILYSENIVNQKWLNFSSNLLLRLSRCDHRYNEKCYDTPLAECDYKEVSINNISSQSQIFTGSFTQNTFGGSSVHGTPYFDKLNLRKKKTGFVKATQQNLFFDETQMDVDDEDRILTNIGDADSISSLFVDFKSDFVSPKDNLKAKKKSIRRRFSFKEKEISGQIFSNFHKRKKARIEKRKMFKKNQVNMFRKYRKGELPDIQSLSIQSVISPLENLCLYESVLARDVFVLLFNTIAHEERKRSNEQSSRILLKKQRQSIKKVIAKILKHSKDDSVIISAILRICLKNVSYVNDLPTSIISDASLQSYNLETGILLIEKIIHLQQNQPIDNFNIDYNELSEDDSVEDKRKRRVNKSWIAVSKLYKFLHENDIVLSIFSNNFKMNEETKKAISYEISGDYKSATKVYEALLKNNDENKMKDDGEVEPSKGEMDFWKNQLLECLYNNNKFDDIIHTLGLKKDESDIWDKFDVILPITLETKLKIKNADLIKFINENTTGNSEECRKRRELVEKRFSDILASSSMLSGELNKAKTEVENGYNNFLTDWSSFPVQTERGKVIFLQKLQRLVEIEEFSDFILTKKDKYKQFTRGLYKYWMNRFPSLVYDEPFVWCNFIHNREHCLKEISKLFELSETYENKESQSQGSQVGFTYGANISMTRSPDLLDMTQSATQNIDVDTKKIKVAEKISELYFEMYYRAAKSAIAQGNGDVAASYRKKIINFPYAQLLDEHYDRGFKCDLLTSKLAILLSIKKKRKGKENDLNRAFKGSFKYLDKAMEKVKSGKWNLGSEKTAKLTKVRLLKASTLLKKFELCEEKDYTILKDSYKEYQSICDDTSNANQKLKYFGKSRYEFACFCRNIIKKKNFDHDIIKEIDKNSENFYYNFVKSALYSIKYNPQHVIELFPPILEIIEKVEATRDTFSTCVEDIPCWNLIIWISQILPHLNGNEGECLIQKLIDITDLYPQSIYFPFNMSQDSISPTSTIVKNGVAKIIAKLGKLTEMDALTDCFEHLVSPNKLVYDVATSILRREISYEEGVRLFKEVVYESVFNPSPSFPNIHSKGSLIDLPKGDHIIRFAKKHSAKFEKIFGKNFSKVYNQNGKLILSRFHKALMAIRKYVHALSGSRGKAQLRSFSPFLSDFHNNKRFDYIEIPGQYDFVVQNPSVKKHTKISSFMSDLLIMSSKQLPKRVIMVGDDEKEYKFLSKCGEDLRLDQRIEQLFSVMNNILLSTPECSKRGLKMKIYKVIPMSTNCGIIEWVDDTKPIKGLLQDELNTGKYKYNTLNDLKNKCFNILMDILEKKMRKKISADGNMVLYVHKYLKRDVCVKYFKKLFDKGTIHPFILKEGLRSLTSSYESFFFLRNNFGKSYSTLSISSYVLGVGDRHSDNFLVDVSTGNAVAIDFGMSFGLSHELLPIPELIPFRLTNQITNIFLPLTNPYTKAMENHELVTNSEGIFIDDMIHVLTAFNKKQSSLISILNIFIKEPLVDWLKGADKKQNDYEKNENYEERGGKDGTSLLASIDTSIKKDDWKPKKKIKLAIQKLNLGNPVTILLEDVMANQPLVKYSKTNQYGKPRQYIKDLLKGKGKDLRKKIGTGNCESIKQQVEILIEIATDPKILASTYSGWGPYL